MALIWVITTKLFWFELSSCFWCKCDVKICAAVTLQLQDGLQWWQPRPEVMDSTKSLIKIVIETIRQWQIERALDPCWHVWLELLRMAHRECTRGTLAADPTGTFSSSPAETRPYSISFGHLPVTHFFLTLYIIPSIWPNFPMSRMF